MEVTLVINGLKTKQNDLLLMYGTKYSRIDKVKFVKDRLKILKGHGLPKVDHTPSNLRLSSTIFTSSILEYIVSNVTQDLL